MTEPDPTTTVICPECSELIEVRDMQTVLLSLHQTNECSQLSGLFPSRDGA